MTSFRLADQSSAVRASLCEWVSVRDAQWEAAALFQEVRELFCGEEKPRPPATRTFTSERLSAEHYGE